MDGSNFLLINVDRGLSPGPMSTSSSSSSDVNPYPSFPSSAKSLQIDKECDKKKFQPIVKIGRFIILSNAQNITTDVWPAARAGLLMIVTTI
jgi:hypothetical protein